MAWLRPLVVFLFLTAPAWAEPLAGSDDPAFDAALTRLLQQDDPAALSALRDLAAAGNTAALVTLPVATGWLPPAPTYADRQALRQIEGAWITDLARAAARPADLWREGAISPLMDDQLDRALQLYALGETAKADALLQAWVNHMPASAALPGGLTDLPAAPVLKAMIMVEHLTRGTGAALPMLQSWRDLDRIEGWMVLAELTGQPIIAPLTPGPNARLTDGSRAKRLLWDEDPLPPLPEETTAMALRDLLPLPQFAPVRQYCSATCAATAPACAAAFVSLLGAPRRFVASATPLQGAVDPARFYASPRGEQVLLAAALRNRLELNLVADVPAALTAHPAYQAAAKRDACFAAGALRSVHPLPPAP
jgi:hypothetical protein